MNAVNSYSIISGFNDIPKPSTLLETYTRTFQNKGLFIVPYNNSQILAGMEVRCNVLFVDNESRSLWTNPELSFYGYCHARQNKQTLGSPVQINLRSQLLFTWVEPYGLMQREIIGTLVNAVQFLSPTANFQFGQLELPSPSVTDFSFGFKQSGRYEVEIKLYYWNPVLWSQTGLPVPFQDLPNPSDLTNTPPPDKFNPSFQTAPISSPYNPETSDFGESDPEAPVTPPETGEPRQVRVRVITEYRSYPSERLETLDRTGEPSQFIRTPVSIASVSIEQNLTFVVRLSSPDGIFDVVVFTSGDFVDSRSRQEALDNANVTFSVL